MRSAAIATLLAAELVMVAACATIASKSRTPTAISRTSNPPAEAAVIAVMPACAGHVPIRGLPVSTGPRLGSVNVYRGWPARHPIGPGSYRLVWPTHMVQEKPVRIDEPFRFFLPRGHYVLVGHYRGGNVTPFAQVTIRGRATRRINLPAICK